VIVVLVGYGAKVPVTLDPNAAADEDAGGDVPAAGDAPAAGEPVADEPDVFAAGAAPG
jgi:hypothetical protein